MIRSWARALALVLVISLGLSACGGGAPAGGPPAAPGPAASGGAAAAVLADTAYRLGSGDKVKVVVFNHEDLSGEFTLDGAGNFAMPLVGEIKAGGLTSRELEQRIVESTRTASSSTRRSASRSRTTGRSTSSARSRIPAPTPT